jgi:hypothetical protein
MILDLISAFLGKIISTSSSRQAHLGKLISTELDERDEREVLGFGVNKKRLGFPSRSFYRKFLITSPHA